MLKVYFTFLILFPFSIFSQSVHFEKEFKQNAAPVGFSVIPNNNSTRYFFIGYSGRVNDSFDTILNIYATDLNGNFLFNNKLDVNISGFKSVSPAAAVSGGGFVITFSKKNNNQRDAFFARYDNLGNQLYSLNVGNPILDDYGSAVENTLDNNFLVLSFYDDPYVRYFNITKIDVNGNIIATKTFYLNFTPIGGKLLRTNDNGFIVQFYNKDYILKLNQNLDSIWTASIGYNSFSLCRSDGNNVVFGGSNKISKMDANGNTLWTSDISVSPKDIKMINDGGYILVADKKIIKADSQGNFVFETTSPANLYSVLQTNDLGFLIGGRTNYFYFLKTDSSGLMINILNPNGGEAIAPYSFSNQKYKISWSNTKKNPVNIDYSTNSGTSWNNIISNFSYDISSYDWIVPTIFSKQCKLKIYYSNNSFLFDFSDSSFAIDTIITLPGGNDILDSITVNQIKMIYMNNGSGSFNPATGNCGFYWPYLINPSQTAIFQDGLVFGGKINNQIYVGGSTYRFGFQAGKILPSGLSDDPNNPKNRIYKLKKNWENLPPSQNKMRLWSDYYNWPVEQGAPWIDVDGNNIYTIGIDKPKIYGDETNFFVMNDMDAQRTSFLYGSLPMKIEVQQIIYGYDRSDAFADVVFKKYKLINKNSAAISDMFISYWCDDDLGNAADDFFGCDTSLKMGYTYNGSNYDPIYGNAPPAVAHQLVQTPIVPSAQNDSARFNEGWRKGFKNVKLNSFYIYICGSSIFRDPAFGTGFNEIYNNMLGLHWNGNQIIHPITNQPTKICVPGDPVNQTGWYCGSGWPGGPNPCDSKYLLTSGPISFAPNDTQEVVVAIFITRGSSNINSIQKLKERAAFYQAFHNNPLLNAEENNISFVPEKFILYQNYPNPFAANEGFNNSSNAATTIKFHVAKKSVVTLKIFDILGREIKVLLNEEKDIGSYQVEFNDESETSNLKLAAGVYFYQFKAVYYGGVFVDSKKFILLK